MAEIFYFTCITFKTDGEEAIRFNQEMKPETIYNGLYVCNMSRERALEIINQWNYIQVLSMSINKNIPFHCYSLQTGKITYFQGKKVD